MADWTKATTSTAEPGQPTASTAGVLRPEHFAEHVELERFAAGDAVTRWVENHWSVRWDLPAGTTFPTQILPHPTCSLTVELGDIRRAGAPDGTTVVVTGVSTSRFDVDTTGWGCVVGVKFRPGGLAALTGRSAAAWTDRTLPAVEVLPRPLCDALADPDLAATPPEWIARAESGLADLRPHNDARYDQLLCIVADMLADSSLVTVADVAARHAVTVRTLQRLFRHFVGVGPKWALARYRLHDAVTAIDGGCDATMTELANRLGWYDQAHFTREFTALVGVPPLMYRDSGPRG